MRTAIGYAVALVLLLVSWASGAAEPGSLESRLRAWLAGVTGLQIPALPLHLEAEGDHYWLTVPIPGLTSPDGPAALSGTVRAIDGGKWEVGGLKLPPSTRFAVPVPDPADPRRMVPMEATLNLAGQDGRALIDPGLAAPSHFALRLDGIALDLEGAGEHQRETIAHYQSSSALARAAGGRLDLTEEAVADGWHAVAQPVSGPPFAISAERLSGKGGLLGLNPARLAPVIAAAAALAAAPRDNDRALRAGLHALVEALRDSIGSGRMEETIEKLRLTIGRQEGGVKTLRLGVAADAPGEQLGVSLDLDAEGFDLASLPPALAAFAPRTISLHPKLSQASVSALTRLALAATEPEPDEAETNAALTALLKGGLSFAVDPFVLELAEARLDGTGAIVASGADGYEARARLAVAGFDALLERAEAEPMLANAVPFLVLARSLARLEGDRLVWNIEASPAGLTVNGADLGPLARPAQPGRRR